MKLKFDASLDYQLDAIRSVTSLFEGLPKQNGSLQMATTVNGSLFNDGCVVNQLVLSTEQILQNLQTVQRQNNLPKSRSMKENAGSYSFPNFSIEMETGTGKTYVYLRSIFELNQLYGFKKFIIVVPSVAIREGVTSSIKMMKQHFESLYNNVAFNHFVYQSKDLGLVRQFAINNEVQIMVINIQAFQKDAGENVNYADLTEEQKKKLNVIHKEQDIPGQFSRPIEYIQATNPILLIDEPQSVDNTEKSQKAIRNLNPLFCLRYSATHTHLYNLIYQLNPIRAFDLRLVKQIEVIDSTDSKNFNQTLVKLDAVGYWPKTSNTPQAKITIFENTPSGTKEIQLKIKHGTDLASKSNRADYEGYLVTNISAEPDNEYIEFQNGVRVELFEEAGGMNDERLKSQIHQTVEAHFEKEHKLKGRGIKVLSLFFIDHVKSYRSYNDNGEPQKEKLAIWFEEAYNAISKRPRYSGLLPFKAEEVHDGYFSADRKKGKIVDLIDTNGGTARDEETYELIMTDKERLLSSEVPLRFIFSHSALKEGWDNPNVFQLCTLREMGTDRERRQTIGRGLRLPVNQDGVRIYDDLTNRLTVIANESFESFAKGLQSDMELAIDPTGNFKFGRVPVDAFTSILHTDGFEYLNHEESKVVWLSVAENGYIDKQGAFTEKFQPDKAEIKLNLPEKFIGLENEVIDRLKSSMPRDFVKDGRQRKPVTYNKRVELNEDFQVLWSKISQKTKYSVEFKTIDLIRKAADKILRMAPIKKVQIITTKRALAVKSSGLEGGQIENTKSHEIQFEQPLPDILGFLQSETELTRGTLVQILQLSMRLEDFKINPQAFMSEAAKLINRALNELIIDGIKYEPIAGQFFEMRLFEVNEVEQYLTRLYKITSNDNRTPFDYIAYDSGKEEEIAKLLDNDEKVKFFCKLPRWFKVSTPIGEYNPDWAVVVKAEDDQRLYLVRETKSTLERDKRRESENKKLDCGKAHFKALGVNFKDAVSINEFLN